MSVVTMIACDNPKCEHFGTPEWIDPDDKVPPSAPYGWYEGDLLCMGPGPSVHVYACSVECVGPAVIQQFELERQEEQ